MGMTLSPEGRGVRLGAVGLLTLATLVGTGAAAHADAAIQALPAGCSGTAPIKCHYAVPPGNYDVTVSSVVPLPPRPTCGWRPGA